MTNVKTEIHWNQTGQTLAVTHIISFTICGVFQYGQGRQRNSQNVAETNILHIYYIYI
jgi:hypothetical protein